jgi:hypothetical protein
MISKREAAEKNVNGDYGVKCINCPFSDGYCTIQVTKSLGCKNACKQWLADNPEESEWKELKIDDLPGDILKWLIQGDDRTHCIEYDSPEYGEWVPTGCVDCLEVLSSASKGGTFRYRKRQPEKKVPSHEEIMTKWWKTDKNGCWIKPVQYFDGFYGFANTVYPIPVKNQCKEWFIGRESADIPPENAE